MATATGGTFARSGESVASEGGAPRADAYGAAFAHAVPAHHAAYDVIGVRETTGQQVGGFAAQMAHSTQISSVPAYYGVLPLDRMPRISKPRPWLEGTPLAGQ